MYPVLNQEQVLVRRTVDSTIYSPYTMGDIMTIATGYAYEIVNRTASEILELCNGINSSADIATNMSQRYNEPFDKAEMFVNNFLEAAEKKAIFTCFPNIRPQTSKYLVVIALCLQ